MITGARGFLGRALAARLNALGLEVHGTTRGDGPRPAGPTRFHTIPEPSMESWRKILAVVGPKTLFHLGSGLERHHSPAETARYVCATLEASAFLLEALSDSFPSAVVLLGTGEEYGAAPVPYREDSQERPRTSYGLARLAVTNLGRQLRSARGWPLVTARPAVVFGPGQPAGSFLEQILVSLRENRSVELTPGDQTRDFIHVEDVVSALLLIAEAPERADVVNISSASEISLRGVADLAATALGRSLPLKFGALPYRTGEPMRYVLDSTRLRRDFGWEPAVPLEEGLGNLLRGVRA